MKKPINFDDLFERVSDNREFADRMLTSFFDTWTERFDAIEASLIEEDYDVLADRAHQLKGILGNLAVEDGFDLLKTIHEEARLKNSKKLNKLLASLKKELQNAQKFYADSKSLFE